MAPSAEEYLLAKKRMEEEEAKREGLFSPKEWVRGPFLSSATKADNAAGIEPGVVKLEEAQAKGDPTYTSKGLYLEKFLPEATDWVGWGLGQQGMKLGLVKTGLASVPQARLASILGPPVYEAAKGALTGRDPLDTLEAMAEAALIGMGFEAGIAGIKHGWKKGKWFHKETAKLTKEALGRAADVPVFRPMMKMFPKTFHGETMRELFQPVIERAEPRLKGALGRKELITDVARQAIAETSKRMEGLSLEEKYHVAEFLQAGRYTPAQGRLSAQFRRLPLDSKKRITHALSPMQHWRMEAGKIDPRLDQPFREMELQKQIHEYFVKKLGHEGGVLDATYLDELLPFVSGKVGVEEARGAFKEVMAHPAVSQEAKMLAKDLYLLHHTVAESFPIAVQHTEKNVLFSKLMSNRAWVSPIQRPGMVESTHPHFKGLWVTKDVDQAIKDFEYVPGLFTRGLNKYFITPWKMNKVVLRVPTHFRNIISNQILNDIGGLPIYRQDIYLKALRELRKNSAGVREFARLSGTGTTFSEVEIAPILRQLEAHGDMLQASDKFLTQLAGQAEKGTAEAAKWFNRAYQLEETWAKYAKYIHNLEKGMTKKAAAEDAVRWTFNYGQVTPMVRLMRESVSPFMTWTAKVLPLMAEAAIDHPLRVAKWMMLPYFITQLATKTAGVTEEEWQTIRKDLPEYLRQGIVGLAPIRDERGRLQLVNYTWFLPGIGDVAGLYQGFGSLKGVGQTLTQNPFISLMADLKHNKTLSGAPIYYDWEPPELKLQKTLGYIWGQLAPGVISTDVRRIAQLGENSPEAPTLGQVAVGAFGIPVQPLVPEELKKRKLMGQRIAVREMVSRAKKEVARATTPEEKRQVLQKYRDIFERFMQREQANQAKPKILRGEE